MSTAIYDSPDDAKPTLPKQGSFRIDITTGTVWFFEYREGDDTRCATVPLDQLPAIYDAIGAHLRMREAIYGPLGEEGLAP